MSKKLLYILAILLTLTVCNVHAADKARMSAKALLLAAESLKIPSADSLPSGTTTYRVGKNFVNVRANKLHELKHVGIPIFSKEMRRQSPSPVYDFIEFAALGHAYSLTSAQQATKSVQFSSGDWNKLLALSAEDVAWTVSCDGKEYSVNCMKGSDIAVAMRFPVQYDVLSFSNKEELERLFIHSLRSADGKQTNHTMAASSNPAFSTQYTHGSIRMLEGDTYLKASITSNLYYRRRGQKYQLFSQAMYPAESLANITLTADATLPTAILNIDFVMYDGTIETVDVTVADWLATVKEDGCQCYYGFDKQDDKTASLVLYASNPSKGYDHVLMLKTDIDQLDRKTVVLKGNGYLFSPTSNVKNLFYKYTKKK